MDKKKTYSDQLLKDKAFKADFDKEYRNLMISEKIAELRHRAHLTQDELAKRMQTTKSAISRYESNRYKGYSIALLERIAAACGADLRVGFIVRNGEKVK